MRDEPQKPAQPLESSADEELASFIAAGSEAAFSVVVRRYHGRMVRLARAFVRTEASAEEITQETWLAVLNGIDRFERRSSFKAWLFRILTNLAKSRAQREDRSLPFSWFDAPDGSSPMGDVAAQFGADGRWLSPVLAWEHDSPQKLLLLQEMREVLNRGIEALPPAQKAVLVMRDVEGLASEDVCKLLELSEANQRVILHRARTALRRAVDSHVAKR